MAEHEYSRFRNHDRYRGRTVVGIEDGEDLLDDLRSALVQAGAMDLSLDGLYAKDPTVFQKDAEEGEQLAAKAAAKNEP